MSDQIKHECGIALIRLLKPLDYYQEEYGTPLYGLNKLQLLLQKQRNRGQDGAGIATIKLDPIPGARFISRKRSNSSNYLKDLFDGVFEHFKDVSPEHKTDGNWLKNNKPYTGEVLMGHLRYGTHGVNTIETCHPFLRQNNWITRNLVLAGNFNLTNVDELFTELIELGQFPKEVSDTVTVMEKIGHFLDAEVQYLFEHYKMHGHSNREITEAIIENIDLQRVLSRACKKFDGGYVMTGMLGHGDAFVIRDPNGIRPAYYFADDEVVAVASERPALMTAFKKRIKMVKEIPRGYALIILNNQGSPEEITRILQQNARFEKLVVKDEKIRTFIADDASRDEMVAHVYDVTYGIVKNEIDTLVLLDDSIVRGTTLRDSIITIISRLFPKKIIVVSSAPQIRYPDCYGIDMSVLKEFVAFQALISLLKESGQEYLLNETYDKCIAQKDKPKDQITNEVRALYDLFPYELISERIADMVKPAGIKPEVEVIYQTVEDLRSACPDRGDWYFSGEYPTAGGNAVVNKAFVNFMEGKVVRAY
ncbi:MAG: hypothetical protein IPI60_17260 [Saprospiraceae bacterium]|nr:hypothetical protein [Saprospiraceae bacterium]